jgi:acylphosphatase
VPDKEIEQREVIYSGNVQGVGFRYTTRSLAKGFAITGYVKNLPDGGVQVVAEGTRSEIEAFLSAIQSEMSGYLRDFRQTTRPASGRFMGFDIRF